MDELSLADYLAILKQRRTYFSTVFLLLFILSTIFTLCWSTYRSTATVEVEQPQVAPSMTTPTGMNESDMPETLADLRISKIEQKISSPASLVDVITKFDLYAGTRKYEPMAAVAKRMGDHIKLTLVSSTVANPAATQKVSVDQLSAIAFTLSFDYSDPQIARQVTNELVTRFLDEDLKERRAEAEATSEFLGSQISLLEASLAEQEKNIAQFESTHGVSRPETLLFDQQAAENTTMSLQNLDAQIVSNEGTQGALRAQLAGVDPYSRVVADGQVLTTPATQLKALEAQYTTLIAQYGPEHPDVVKVSHQIDALRAQTGVNDVNTGPLKAQIQDVKTNLDAALKTYGPDNPDVISLQHQLDSLQTQLAAAKATKAPADALKKDADNPAYLQLVAQLRAAEEQHTSLIAQRALLAAQQEKYEHAVTQNPELTQQMEALSRDHDNAEQRYRELKERKMAADMDVTMIQDRKGQRLVVISPPDLPLHTHPPRLILFIGGLFLSLLGGIGAVMIAQAINQNVTGAKHLTSLVGVPPLVVIPHILTEAERNRPLHMAPIDALRNLIKSWRRPSAARP